MILITGGAGYIGTHLTLRLLQDGYSIIVYDDLSNSTIDNLRRLADAKVNQNRFLFTKGDIRDRIKLDRLFRKHRITRVIHLAGLKSINESILNEELYYDVNVNGSRNVFELAFQYDVYTVIFSSTAAVYKPTHSGEYTELSIVDGASSPYGQNKIDAENILHDLKVKDITIDVVVLRYFNPVGTDKTIPLFEENINTNNLFPNILQNIKDNTYFLIHGNDYDTRDGTAIRDYIHIFDLVDVHRLMLDEYVLFTAVRIFNVGSGTGYSVREIVEAFNRNYIRPVLFRYANRRAGDVAISIADTTKIRDTFDWEPSRDLSDMVRSVLDTSDVNKRK